VSPSPAPPLPAPTTLQDTPQQLQDAITSYYALIPGNLQEGWTRLTASYQNNKAGGFAGYQQFWSAMQRVTVSNVVAKPGDTVDATIDYFNNDGRVIEEQTSFQMVADGGEWKINDSTVTQSQTKSG
jgi:hypothetical protein